MPKKLCAAHSWPTLVQERLVVWGKLRLPESTLNSPPPPQLDHVIEELATLAKHRPAVRAKIRARLVRTASLGGARPKATVRSDDGQFWLIKPGTGADMADIPRLEHVGRQWGAASGSQFAETIFHPAAGGPSAVRVRRFDRNGSRRRMCVSAATLLQAEFPDDLAQADRWSYPRLAGEPRLVGAPAQDRIELFGRMVFHAVCGNDDDHVRNHAILYRAEERRWRLAPACDVVPNPAETPARLRMQLSVGRFDIARDAVLADAHRFGFAGRDEAAAYLDTLLARIAAGFDAAAPWLDQQWRQLLHAP